jgi:hypothetical protein
MNHKHPGIEFVGTKKHLLLFGRSAPTSYTPDFWDEEQQTYYEVKSSRTEYLHGARIYKAFRRYYPQLRLEVVTPSGERCDKLFRIPKMFEHRKQTHSTGVRSALETVLSRLYRCSPKRRTHLNSIRIVEEILKKHHRTHKEK